MGSTFSVGCIARNFYFILTGMGKGCFNLFLGSLMLINNDIFSKIVAGSLLASGVLFIFLSKVKKLTDEDLQRATSIYTDNLKKEAKEGVVDYAKSHKEEIKQAAWDNREVIAQVAYDHKDSIANAAYDNKELLAESYIK